MIIHQPISPLLFHKSSMYALLNFMLRPLHFTGKKELCEKEVDLRYLAADGLTCKA